MKKKFILFDSRMNPPTEVFESDDLHSIEKTMNALMVNDQNHMRDMKYDVVDSETGEVLHCERKCIDANGQWQLSWFMSPEVAKVIGWSGILDSRTVKDF